MYIKLKRKNENSEKKINKKKIKIIENKIFFSIKKKIKKLIYNYITNRSIAG